MTGHLKFVLHLAMFAAVVTTLLGSSLVVTPAFATTTIRHAKATGGKTSGACTTWGTACTLQRALSVAAAGNQVWVKAGVYMPTSTTDQTISFNVKPGVKVYGGFAGSETVLTQRNPKTHVTVLSGDIDKNDAHHRTTNIDLKASDIHGNNSYHVVTMDGTGGATVTASTVLDGFTVTGGEAYGPTPPQFSGGGLNCNGENSGKACSPTLTNLTFSGNTAELGGAMYNDGAYGGTSNPTLTHLIFIGNNSAGNGGAIYNDGHLGGASSPSLTNVTFTNNIAPTGNGGAVYNDGGYGASAPKLTNVTFNSNNAANGGGMYNGGSHGQSNPTLTNVTFKGNHASSTGYGGALFNEGYAGISSPRLTNVTFSGNSAGYGGAMLNDGSNSGSVNPSLKNVILWGDTAAGVAPNGPEIYNYTGAETPVINYSIVKGGDAGSNVGTAFSSGTGNRNANPKLNALGYYSGGFTKTMSLKAGSPAIDHGTNSGCTAKDQNGLARPQDGDHNGSKICDMGSTEYP